jgi:hypothetical protein
MGLRKHSRPKIEQDHYETECANLLGGSVVNDKIVYLFKYISSVETKQNIFINDITVMNVGLRISGLCREDVAT